MNGSTGETRGTCAPPRLVEVEAVEIERTRLDRRHGQLEAQLAAVARQCAAAEALLAGAPRLDEELDGWTFARLLHTLTGDLAERRAENTLAAARARSEVSSSAARLADLTADLATVERRRAALPPPIGSSRLTELRQERESELRALGDPRAAQLDRCDAEAAGLMEQRRELDDAISAAGLALNAIDDLLDALESAHSWGTYDAFLGGGFIASSIKHRRLDEANAQAARVASAMRRLAAELEPFADLDRSLTELSPGRRFFDMWLDNFFTDVAVQRRITDALTSAEGIQERIGTVAHRLRQRREQTDRELADLGRRRSSIVAAATTGSET